MKVFRSKILLTLAASALLLAGAACSSHERNDAQIIGDVTLKIQADPQVTNKNIAVMASNGVVTLNGSASNDAARMAAAKDAAQVEGVKTVVNNLAVAAPAVEAKPEVQAQQPPHAQPERKSEEHSSHAKLRKPTAMHVKEASKTTKQDDSPAAYDPSNNTGIVYTSSATASSPAVSSSSAPTSVPATTPPTSTPLTTAALHSDAATIPPPPPPVKMVTVGSGTPITVRLVDPIDTKTNRAGDTFHATLDAPVYVNEEVAIPEGASVEGRIVDMQDSGRFAGRPQLALELTSLYLNNRHYRLETNEYTKQGGSQGSRTAKSVGGGAALGALIGAIAGGGKGAAIGAAIGAAGGGGVQAARGAQSLHLGSEARLRFQLASPVSVTPASTINRGSTNDISNSSASMPLPDDTYDNGRATPVDTPDGDRPVLKRRPAPPKYPDGQPN